MQGSLSKEQSEIVKSRLHTKSRICRQLFLRMKKLMQSIAQEITQATTQAAIEAAKAAVQALTVIQSWGRDWAQKWVSKGPKLGRPTLKQSTFDWSAIDKSTELRNKTGRLSTNYQQQSRHTGSIISSSSHTGREESCTTVETYLRL